MRWAMVNGGDNVTSPSLSLMTLQKGHKYISHIFCLFIKNNNLICSVSRYFKNYDIVRNNM